MIKSILAGFMIALAAAITTVRITNLWFEDIVDISYIFLAADTKILLPASAALLYTIVGNIIPLYGCRNNLRTFTGLLPLFIHETFEHLVHKLVSVDINLSILHHIHHRGAESQLDHNHQANSRRPDYQSRNHLYNQQVWYNIHYNLGLCHNNYNEHTH